MERSKEITFEIHSFQDIEKAVEIARQEYHKTTAPIRHILDGIVSLLLELLDLIGNVAKNTDEERYALEVLIVTFRRTISSIVLLESGLPQEAHMVLRNALEWILIAVDIIYNKTSLQEWGKTSLYDVTDKDEWYFKPSKIHKRIDNNEENTYPEPDRSLALHTYKEWINISNKSVHAHAHSQIKNLFSETGTFQFLGRKTIDKYEIDFKMYQGIIFDIVTLLIGIPKYRNLIGKTETLAVKRDNFARNYAKLQKELSITGRMIFEPTPPTS